MLVCHRERAHGGVGLLWRRAASPSDCSCSATSCSIRRAAFPSCHVVFSQHQPTSSPRTAFSRRRRQWLSSSAPQRPASTRPSRGDLDRVPRRHLGRRQVGNISASSAPQRPTSIRPSRVSFTEPHAATWDAGRTTTSAEVYEVAGDDFSPNHWTPDYSQPRASSSQYFSNLMTQDDLEFLNPPDATPSIGGKGASKRGSNYSDLEDIQLCKSWIHISNDPIIGNGQPTKTYWERIGNDFHSNRDFESDRTPNSLEHCFAIILKECMKFQGYYEEVERGHPSGIPYQEHLLEAHARYARKAKGKN